jgi:hypothetical protein
LLSLLILAKITDMTFTHDTYSRFKSHYLKATKNKKEKFTFDGHEFLTGYAKYLLMFLKPKFEK